MICNLYIFDRKGFCLYYKEWNRPRSTLEENPEEDRKLMFGLIFSLKHLVKQISPGESSMAKMNSYATSGYKCHHFETATGYHFVMNSDKDTKDLGPSLRAVYADIFVPHVVRNPFYEKGTKIELEEFSNTLDLYVKNLASF
eukprot:TRINITY_DN773165_c0_g1_i1.p1 TRINITY_DN773165_c0_g1~~TRINITY_DN773165_c0_g1_i1.p1  ORF type:complete len:142 (+),score=15.01 TRINITY_DN773165_c0_g1_i1:34-459(+)